MRVCLKGTENIVLQAADATPLVNNIEEENLEKMLKIIGQYSLLSNEHLVVRCNGPKHAFVKITLVPNKKLVIPENG